MFYLMMHSTHFILQLHDVGHVVKHHSDSQRKNPIATIILQGIGLCYTRLEQEIAQWVHHEESI